MSDVGTARPVQNNTPGVVPPVRSDPSTSIRHTYAVGIVILNPHAIVPDTDTHAPTIASRAASIVDVEEFAESAEVVPTRVLLLLYTDIVNVPHVTPHSFMIEWRLANTPYP
jgi:hypothetical protein